MPPLTTKEKYIIQGMHADDKSVPEIAKEISRSETAVTNYLTKLAESLGKVLDNKAEQNEDNPPEQTPRDERGAKKDKSGIIHHTAGKGTRNVSVMTKGASERFDEKRKAGAYSKNKKGQNPAIFVIDKNKKKD